MPLAWSRVEDQLGRDSRRQFGHEAVRAVQVASAAVAVSADQRPLVVLVYRQAHTMYAPNLDGLRLQLPKQASSTSDTRTDSDSSDRICINSNTSGNYRTRGKDYMNARTLTQGVDKGGDSSRESQQL
jgi:hypothetical protein